MLRFSRLIYRSMASVVAQRVVDDGRSTVSSISNPQYSDLEQSVDDAPEYSRSQYYKPESRASSLETMLSIAPDDSSEKNSALTPSEGDENTNDEYGSPTENDLSDGINNEERTRGMNSAQNCNPDPPVMPGMSVMRAKDNIVNSSSEQRGTDSTDGTDVYKSTTEPIEEEPSCCLSLSTGKRTRRKGNAQQNEDEIDTRDNGPKIYYGYQGRQWLLLFVLLSGTLTSSFAVCLFPPFFPKIAQQKGATATIFGMIIGTNCLTAFLFTPIIGKKLKHIGVKFAFTAGLFCSGGCCVLSGFLEWFPSGAVFVVMAVLIRMTHAIANAGISTSTFAYIAAEFPDSVAKIFAFTRTTMNVAQMLGPVVGGALYALGGFKMPFLVMGTIQMTMTLVALFYLADYKDVSSKCPNTKKSEIQISQLFAIPGIWVSFLTFIFSTMSNGFLSVTLEPLVLRKFDLGPLYVGLLFGLKDGANSLASPLWGWVCDRYRRVKVFILMASCLAFMSFVLLGPLPGLPIKSTLGIVILALTLNGFGIGGQQVAGVVDAMREAVSAGFPDEAGTHGCVAGLWASLSGAGRFTSRAGTGILVDHIGFRRSSVVVVSLHALIIIITILYLLTCKEKKYRRFTDVESNSAAPPPDLVVDSHPRVKTVLTTSPSEPITTKAVNIDVASYKEDIEDSIFLGTSPIPTPSRYAREDCKFASPRSSSSVSS